VVAPLSPDEARLAAIREALPAVNAGIYLNTVAAGPLPAEAARAMADEAAREATLGRAHPADVEETLERVAEARAAIAAILATDYERVALTRGAGHGIELACAAIPWRPGDRCVFVSRSDGTGPWPVHLLAGLGVEVIELRARSEPDALLDAVQAAMRGGTTLVGLPHVDESDGSVLPVGRVSELAHAAGASVVLDASASIGSMKLDLEALDADAIAFPAERWLLGPVGLGGLWCGPRSIERIARLAPDGFALPVRGPSPAAPTAAAPDVFPPWHRPSLVGFARSCGLLAMQIGLPWAWERGQALAERAAAALRSIDGVQVLTPVDMATIVSFQVRGWPAEAALEELGARVFAIASIVEALDAVRISLGAWNGEGEIDRFVEAVGLLAAHTADTIPPRRTLQVLE
jgi:selenocysteine lyase/cysteine desulfurase